MSLVTWAHFGIPEGLCGITFSLSLLCEGQISMVNFTQEVPQLLPDTFKQWTGQLLSLHFSNDQLFKPQLYYTTWSSLE